MKVVRLCALLAAVAMSACSTNIGAGYKIPASPNVGLAAGSLTYTGMLGERILLIENTKTKEKFAAAVGVASTIIPFQTPSVDSDINDIGGLFALELPAGPYNVSLWIIHQGQMRLRPTEAFTLPFEVKAGSSVYLGNYHIEQTETGFLRTSKAEMTVQSKAARDIPALKKRFPVFQSIPITEALAENTRIEKLGSESRRTIDFILPVFVPLPR
jgi:hypothetical protein